ncbi:NAD(P)-dependent oxidoreductase [Ketobacter alkanivorans]|uniref:Oxidoreductase n=1 Tax=Ketobacter alkanivorans TaxID=1917421 RepID=A0A2K9LG97_9GAMM|nr:NAD(P)-dependent oxidoreductase [Ketobacter alkanivorans]AUM11270.1 oxidoreductase [Ketobacter alkanivorans]
MKLAFIGLGVIGYPAAGHLSRAGHNITVFNRTASKAAKWVSEYNGASAASPAAAATSADVIFTCVGNDDDLREVVIGGEGILTTVKPGAILVDHTTASAEVATELAGILKERDACFIDAPVSGGQQGAESGQLTVMCGGDPNDFEKISPLVNAYAKQVTLMGPAGSGQLTKMVNQICIAGLIQSLAEGVQFAQNAGLDVEQVFDVIGKGAAQSWQMDNRHKTMNDKQYEYGFAVDWMRKDLAICLNEARKNGSHLPVAALVDQFYSEVQKMGGGRRDTSSLLKRLLS